MSRCVACNTKLSDFEATRKIVHENGKIEYPDLCNTCFGESGLDNLVMTVERHDLKHDYNIDDDDYNELKF